MLSPVAKIGAALGLVLILVLLIGGTVGLVNHFKDAAYEKREVQREAERAQLETEKQQVQLEKARAETRAAEAEAAADAYKTVAESKRADRGKTAKELEQIERLHSQKKAEAEATGSQMSDADLRTALCLQLQKRGYKVECN